MGREFNVYNYYLHKRYFKDITSKKLLKQGRPQADARDSRAYSKFGPQFYFFNQILNVPDFPASPQLQSLLASTFCNNWLSHFVVIDVIPGTIIYVPDNTSII